MQIPPLRPARTAAAVHRLADTCHRLSLAHISVSRLLDVVEVEADQRQGPDLKAMLSMHLAAGRVPVRVTF